MADDITLNAGTGGDVVAADDIGGVKYQRVKLVHGADGVNSGDVSTANPFPVDTELPAAVALADNLANPTTALVGACVLAWDGATWDRWTGAVTQSGTWTVTGAGGTFPVTDSGGSLTVDNAVLSVVGGGTEATAQRVTIATDSTGVLSVDDNGSSLTVDGTVTASMPADVTLNDSIPSSTSSTLTIGDGISAVAVRVSGTWVGTLDFEGSVDAVTWDPVYGVRAGVGIPYTQITESLADNIFRFTTAGFRQIRARFTRTSGTVLLAWRASYNVSGVYINFPLPPGTNAIGKLAANSGVDIGDVDVTSVVPGTGATSLGKAEDAAHTSGDVGVMALSVRQNTAAALSGADADYQPLITDANGRLHVVNSAGVAGDLAHDAADSGNPLKIGAQARTTNPTAVTDGQRVNLIADKVGKLITVGAIRDLKGVQKTTITSSTAETTIVTAVASTFLDLYGLIISNTSATACNVTIKDATAGTTRAILAVPAGDTRGFMLPVDSAIVQAAVNNNWTATCSASVASIEITAMYVKNL